MKLLSILLFIVLILSIPGCTSGGLAEELPAAATKIKDPLLTDAQMVTEKDPKAPAVDPAWATWIKNNIAPVRSVTHDAGFPDLQFLKTLLADRTIVQLGESSHGVREFNQAKVRLIKFLHQQMGFDVIAFESNLFTCYYTNENIKGTPLEMSRGSIYGVWRTKEVNELFAYIKETQATDRPLILAGFDMKSSAMYSSLKRPGFLRDIIQTLDPEYAGDVFRKDTEFLSNVFKTGEEYFIENEEKLKQYYGKLLAFFDTNMEKLLRRFPQDPKPVLVARQSVWSFIRCVEYINAYTSEQEDEVYYRDHSMAVNLFYLSEKVYPGKKIMVWGHNYHLRHAQAAVSGENTMGYWVKKKFGPKAYTVGLYMYRGQLAGNDRKTVPVTPAHPGSLEAIGYHARLKHFFLDMSNQIQVPGNSWMFRKIPCKSWRKDDMPAVLRNQYDGILFIDTTRAPEYITWKKKQK